MHNGSNLTLRAELSTSVTVSSATLWRKLIFATYTHNVKLARGKVTFWLLTTSLRSKLSNTVLSSWAQASWSGLLERSSSCPLNWSVTSGRSPSRQSAAPEQRQNCAIWITQQMSILLELIRQTYMQVWCTTFFPPASSCVKCHYVVFRPQGLLPGCLKRSLSTILHMQPSFWRTSCKSGMLSMNFASRTLMRERKKAKIAVVTVWILFHI